MKQGSLMKKRFTLTSQKELEDIIAKNVDFDLIDYFEKVTDKDGAIFARRLAKKKVFLLAIPVVVPSQLLTS